MKTQKTTANISIFKDEIRDIILKGILLEKKEIPDEKYKVYFTITADEIRQAYVLGMVDAESVEKYDLFKCRKTVATFHMHGDKAEQITIEEIYE